MRPFISFYNKYMNSWSEISTDKTLRLRNNVLIFTFIIICMCLTTTVLITIDYGIVAALPTIALVIISISLFCHQLFNPAYSLLIACLLAVLGFAMAVFLIWTGGVEGTGFLWLYVLPITTAMGLSLRNILIYDCILMTIVLTLLNTPLRHFMSYDYSIPLRISIPLSLLFVIIFTYMTELARHNTQKELIVISKKLQDAAITDPLTETYNRRALEMHFGNMNEKRPDLAFAMLDLDHFKEVNDNYGHDVGDKVLDHVVKLARESVPADTNLYRWGGEEFLLVFTTNNPDDLTNSLDCLRVKIENTPLVINEVLRGTINVTVSIGGSYPNQDLTIGECIHIADMHLYEAKEKGRNRVVM